MLLETSSTRRLITLTLAMGTLGGTVLVLGSGLVGGGRYVLALYAAVIGAMIVVTRLEHVPSFSACFAVMWGGFMISSLALYVAIALSPNSATLPPLGHAWRLGVLLLIGAAVSLATARLAVAPRRVAAPA